MKYLPDEKLCRRCNRTLPAAAFGMRAEANKGLRAWCLECESPDALKYCKHCQTRKPLSEFHTRRDAKGATHKGWCKPCQSEYGRKWRMANYYGLTVEEYDRLWMSQLGLCAICEMEPEDGVLRVDHNHACCPGQKTCGKCVRGLLCDTCNRGLGMFYDKPEWLMIAARYLENS